MPSLVQQWILCSEWVPSEWESKQLRKTLQSHHSSPSVNVLWSQKLIYCNRHLKQIHHDNFLNNIVVHNIAFSSKKNKETFISEIKTLLNKYVGGFWCERTTGDELFHRRKRFYGCWTVILTRSDGLKLKGLSGEFVYNKHTAIHFTRC